MSIGPRSCLATAALCVLAVGCGRARVPWGLDGADPATRRDPPAGRVVGGGGGYGAQAWLGVPYAQPPVGTLRWRAPKPMPRWQGAREALTFGPACMQFGSRLGGVPGVRPGDVGGSEDCLTLNVWTPPFRPESVPTDSARLPVMVWTWNDGE